MKAARRRQRRHRTVTLADVIAISPVLATMDASLVEQGYSRASGRLYPCRDGSYTARIVWRHRDAGLTVAGSAQGLVLG